MVPWSFKPSTLHLLLPSEAFTPSCYTYSSSSPSDSSSTRNNGNCYDVEFFSLDKTATINLSDSRLAHGIQQQSQESGIARKHAIYTNKDMQGFTRFCRLSVAGFCQISPHLAQSSLGWLRRYTVCQVVPISSSFTWTAWVIH